MSVVPAQAARRVTAKPKAAVQRALSAAVDEIVRSRSSVAATRHLELAAAALALAEAADRLARSEIITARDEDGATWEQVGESLGISRQAAHERFRTGPDGMHSRL